MRPRELWRKKLGGDGLCTEIRKVRDLGKPFCSEWNTVIQRQTKQRSGTTILWSKGVAKVEANGWNAGI
jgi:hypothetical protein